MQGSSPSISPKMGFRGCGCHVRPPSEETTAATRAMAGSDGWRAPRAEYTKIQRSVTGSCTTLPGSRTCHESHQSLWYSTNPFHQPTDVSPVTDKSLGSTASTRAVGSAVVVVVVEDVVVVLEVDVDGTGPSGGVQLANGTDAATTAAVSNPRIANITCVAGVRRLGALFIGERSRHRVARSHGHTPVPST